MAVSARSYAPGRPGAACRYVLSPRRRPTTPELSRWILNGRKPVTAHVAAVLDDALDAAGEIVAAAEAEMASRLPRDMVDLGGGRGDRRSGGGRNGFPPAEGHGADPAASGGHDLGWRDERGRAGRLAARDDAVRVPDPRRALAPTARRPR